ncbi:DNA-binding transcriptional regulator, LysR family [Actinacidiphila yanglinensis]|uniref:DNA-binding transcriptional regulator, LysR family n=1 Tax=Actinacidiphila yanglinensis TaxID=310779 RepID=A0A1H6DAD5_9ACTN|nr:LysR family transcriptional regulator [Actinacidiphila yanglinensis]SEG81793.1 DNA-binding transcriptional regulator, LysR family [Actinacidiphila yanglinensis]
MTGVDVDLRKLRYFVAVAEELHFGRAAERLHIAQPVLSRQIRALEGELRVRLLERDRRGATLTPAGEQLVGDARNLLAAADGLTRRVREAAGDRRFVVAFMPGITVTGPVQELLARHPGLDVQVMRTGWHDQATVLLDGSADVGFVRTPVDRTGLRLRRLYDEPRVAVLPRGHRLAGRGAIGIADLAGDVLLQDPDAVPEWRDLPDRREARSEPPMRTVEEKLEYVASLQGVVILPRSAAAFYTRADVCHVEVADIAGSGVLLAWAASHEAPLVTEFAALTEQRPAAPAA